MKTTFSKVGVIGKPNHKATKETVTRICEFLTTLNVEVTVIEKVQSLQEDEVQKQLTELSEQSDLVIVVGGDGNMLGAARALSKTQTPVIGVNRGNLGFLTDVNPEAIENTFKHVFKGHFKTEKRFILDITINTLEGKTYHHSAVNEAVLHSGQVAQMMEFEVYIDDTFMFSQRADGLIVCTPTGSTAYSLSGGGPILTPDLEVVCLQPMFPHSLSNRPIVVDANSTIRLVMSHPKEKQPAITFDGHITQDVSKGDEIIIRKQKEKLHLIHPKDYSYYNVIRRKLNWGSKLY